MAEQDNRAVVQRGYEAFGRGDIAGFITLLDPAIEWVTSGPPELLFAGTRRGHQQVGEFFQAIDSMFEIQRFEPHTFIAQGDLVAVLGSETARVRATGKVLEVEWAHAFTLKNGKVVAFREYLDTAAVVAELRATQAST